jgi:hypothetical protein
MREIAAAQQIPQAEREAADRAWFAAYCALMEDVPPPNSPEVPEGKEGK